jgi:hypothetical protein
MAIEGLANGHGHPLRKEYYGLFLTLLYCTVCPEGEYHAEWLEGLAILLRIEYYVMLLTLLYCVSRGRVPC